ncbi:hypothetical protein EL18_01392 [Nitratireductor basaltis]|uniref:Uncharacterized protein n=1 Tax=Nitratireductor basaltis TaxID=472175 RepID=A0A084UBM5_9HYPH|nr:hypothetical protein EL18_01392 [Nitratireductor basaltis]
MHSQKRREANQNVQLDLFGDCAMRGGSQATSAPRGIFRRNKKVSAQAGWRPFSTGHLPMYKPGTGNEANAR